MDAVSRDDIIHAIEQTVSFYGKSLDKTAIGFWLNGLRDKDPVMIKRALMMYAAKGKYAPKPVDILEIIDSLEGSRKSKLPPPKIPESKCPPEIAKAWAWFIKFHSGHDFGAEDSVSEEIQGKYLHIVNHEAHRHGMPEAIPDEYKLREVWG